MQITCAVALTLTGGMTRDALQSGGLGCYRQREENGKQKTGNTLQYFSSQISIQLPYLATSQNVLKFITSFVMLKTKITNID